MGSIVAFFVSKEVPWKWIGVFLAVLGLCGVIFAGYLHVENMQKDLEQAKSDLAQERVLKEEAKARSAAILAEHDVQIERINDLEDQRSKIAVEVMGLRNTLANLDIEGDIESDNADKANAAVGRLNARNAELNRMLNSASGSGSVRTGQGAGGKASSPSSGPTLQRAVQTLR